MRRQDQVAPLLTIGADAVVVDGPNLKEHVNSAVGGMPIRLAFDAVAGGGAAQLARCLVRSGTVVTYGLLSSGDCVVSASDVVFRDVSLRGFWFTHWFEAAPTDDRNAVYDEVGRLIRNGTLKVEIEAVYPMSEVKKALLHASRSVRRGKILLMPNPHLMPA